LSRRAAPAVLAIADVRTSLVAAARVHAPLRALREAGLIRTYAVIDSTLRGAPRRGRFDVVWLQRATDGWLARALADRLPGRYLLDMDDHLLCRPSYLRAHDLPPRDPVVLALRNCAVLTTPSARLARLLGQRSGVDLDDRNHVCPNAVAFDGLPAQRQAPPAAILLTQGHALALTESRHEILTAIVDAARRHELPVWSLGTGTESLGQELKRPDITLQALRARSWDEYHHDLAGPVTVLGVAPLETTGDADTLEFVSGKSDVKMVEFGGFGHPAVFSDAPPYTETDLRCGRVVPNDGASWGAAIDDLVDGGWQVATQEAPLVRAKRDLRLVAAECWGPAVEAARLQEPLDASELFTTLDRARALARDRVERARWRLAHLEIPVRRRQG
jgi:hypothetical protein